MKASLSELSGLVDRPLETPTPAWRPRGRSWSRAGPRCCVLSLGAEGALLVARADRPTVHRAVGAGLQHGRRRRRDARRCARRPDRGRGLASASASAWPPAAPPCCARGRPCAPVRTPTRWPREVGDSVPWAEPQGTFRLCVGGPCQRGWPGRIEPSRCGMLGPGRGTRARTGRRARSPSASAASIGRSGVMVRVVPVGDLHDLEPYDAVVLGSTIHHGAWLPEATEVVRANAEVLAAETGVAVQRRDRHGPAASPAGRALQEGPKAVAAIERQIRPRATGSSPARPPDQLFQRGRLLFWLTRYRYSDYRVWPEIDAWAGDVAEQLALDAHGRRRPARRSRLRTWRGAATSRADLTATQMAPRGLAAHARAFDRREAGRLHSLVTVRRTRARPWCWSATRPTASGWPTTTSRR